MRELKENTMTTNMKANRLVIKIIKGNCHFDQTLIKFNHAGGYNFKNFYSFRKGEL